MSGLKEGILSPHDFIGLCRSHFFSCEGVGGRKGDDYARGRGATVQERDGAVDATDIKAARNLAVRRLRNLWKIRKLCEHVIDGGLIGGIEP